jgi:hypothetical protein
MAEKVLAIPGFMVRPRVCGHTFSKRIQASFFFFDFQAGVKKHSLVQA